MTNIPEYDLLISSISHEIRNPVTLINSYLQLMERNHPEVTSFSQWQPIQRELLYLCRLLEELSALHRGEDLRLSLVNSYQWLSEYARSARALIQNIQDKDTVFTVQLEKGLPLVPMDQTKIRQVLDNLIRNSTEAATGPNTITLSAFVKEQYLCIQVSDTGCGIPDEELFSIFSPFATHKSQGTGLGLPISKRIAVAHKGDLVVRSALGQGSVFTLLLPTCQE